MKELAQALGWDTVEVEPLHLTGKKIEEVDFPRPIKFKFKEGHKYQINDRRPAPRNPDSRPYVFTYEGKEGIHHMFREVIGKWTRTYTDAQLIGKTIEECKS